MELTTSLLLGPVGRCGFLGLLAKAEPYAAQSGKWVLAQVGGLGFMLPQFLLVIAQVGPSLILFPPSAGCSGWAIRAGVHSFSSGA